MTTVAAVLQETYHDVPLYLHKGRCRNGGQSFAMTGAFLRRISKPSELDLALRMLRRHSRARKTHEYDAVTKVLFGSMTQQQLARESQVHQSTISDALASGIDYVINLI